MNPPSIERLIRDRKIDASGCWLWVGSLDSRGYGRLGSLLVHRLAARQWLGLETKGWAVQVLHRCDVKRCFNPDHLYLGDHWQNMKDRDDRGLKPIGLAHGHHKLTPADINPIREAYMAGEAQKSIGDRFGVSQGTVSALLAGKTWGHVSSTVEVRLRRVGAPTKHGRYAKRVGP